MLAVQTDLLHGVIEFTTSPATVKLKKAFDIAMMLVFACKVVPGRNL